MTGIASSNRFLYVLVFVVGISTLGAEIAAARLMAPFFGASTIVWANTIGVVLVALSIGYWLGGRLGDRYPSVRSLCLAVMAAALMLALVPLVSQPFFDLSVDALDEIEAGAFIGSLFAVLVLIAVPVGLAGTCSPWAIRLTVPDVEHRPEQGADRRDRVQAPGDPPGMLDVGDGEPDRPWRARAGEAHRNCDQHQHRE